MEYNKGSQPAIFTQAAGGQWLKNSGDDYKVNKNDPVMDSDHAPTIDEIGNYISGPAGMRWHELNRHNVVLESVIEMLHLKMAKSR